MNTIAVTLDGRDTSTRVLDVAAPLARALGASLRVITVLEKDDDADLRAAWLREALKELKDVDVQVETRSGDAAREILACVREREPLFLAMTTHGRRGLERLRVGSVAEEVVRGSDLPLVLARPDTASARGEPLLVALDGSPHAERVLPDVVRIAKAQARPLELVSVALPVVTAGGVGEFPMYFPQDDPEPYLKGVAARLAGEGVPVKTVALSGRAAVALVEYARERKAGFLALTTHGRGGLRRALLGSVAEEVLRTAPCPVIVRRGAVERKKKGR
jgi:nucleotide-binding universal stress UspA family protein